VEKEKKKKRTLEYLQQFQDEVLEEEAEVSKHKEIATGDKKGQQSSKKAKGKQQGKYYRNAVVKIGGPNPCERYVSTGQNCLVHHSR